VAPDVKRGILIKSILGVFLIKMEQPKDYTEEEFPEAQSFNDWLRTGYDNLNVFEKLIFHLQLHPIRVIIVIFLLGYGTGIYFGKFW
jgi:hypothetical protein